MQVKPDIPTTFNSKYVILTSNFYQEVTTNLITAAVATLRENGVNEQDIITLNVPGAWEMPVTAQKIINQGDKNIKAIIILGAVIRGETQHFDYVSSNVCHAFQDMAVKTTIPISLGLITANNKEQVFARSDYNPANTSKNQGCIAAKSAFAMASLFNSLN